MKQLQPIKPSDLMTFINWAKVVKVLDNEDKLVVEDLDTGTSITVEGKALIQYCSSADRYAQEEKVTKTRAAEILITSYNKPFTVAFIKQDGSERILRGRLITAEPLLGRSMVEDLDVDRKQHRQRQVDHRTIKWIIVENVKYLVK